MDRPSFLSGVVRWLRAGYPEGVPNSDYLPLFALLRRQLTEEEIRQVALELVDTPPTEPISRIDVGVEISKVTQELPREQDIERVRQTLEAAEWPFDDAPLTPSDDSDAENPEEPS
ncbi:DUF3349 domain-containing protein [Gordonia neofelifaecis]|uniref:DUF3349 domain-containing protein n=1 Tax=Gordonia neofelifaecis NRRL B-59395 TaxID=644548 RepID=F1YIN4_9ACTN|nr:DUF3349 domain-containing protein [Gordonia neofelifaecis]EGD55342.1 hypothetical protein SCNU_08791 [Gordonia neofelifaecis NRRL B-59395]